MQIFSVVAVISCAQTDRLRY